MIKKFISLDSLITLLAVSMAFYHLIYTMTIFQDPILHQNTHFGFALLLVFLLGLKQKSKKWRPAMAILILMTLVSIIYVQINYDALLIRGTRPTDLDVVIGVMLVIVGLVSTWQAFGMTVPIVTIIIIIYPFIGSYLPQPFTSYTFSFDVIISKFGIGIEGIYGTILGVSANYIFLFVFLGGLLEASGVIRFFTTLGNLAARYFSGGPAMTAVASSALVGMVMGSGPGNVAVTGVYTIPLMKKVGYRPEQAGAIEAAASTGGQIMPPVLGAAAFVMMGVTGIPYVQIMAAAIIPAILYFATIGFNIQLRAQKLGLKFPRDVKINVRETILYGALFVIPVAVMVILMVLNFSPMFAGFWAIVSLVTSTVISNPFRSKEERISFTQWIKAFREGAISGAKIGVVCGVLGPIVASMVMTGLAIKIPYIVEMLSGGSVAIALVITMLVAVFLGMGLPIVAVYTVVAVVVGPLLLNAGVPLLPAHFFIFFFAVFAGVTPPVAMCAMVGANLAKANYMKTALEAWKMALAGFILPFGVIYCPWVIMKPTDLVTGIVGMAALLLSIIWLSMGLEGFYLRELNWLKRSLLMASGLLAFVSLLNQNYIYVTIGIVLFIGLTVKLIGERRIAKPAGETIISN